MKRLLAILASVVLVAALAMPLLAHGPGWSTGRHMMGPWGSGQGYCGQNNRGYENLTEKQRSQLEELDRKFYNETAQLRNEIWAKSAELNSLLNSANPDPEKAKALHKELNELRTKMHEKRLEYEFEVRKIAPESQFSGMYGRGYGYRMRGFGHGMDYGPGICWD